MADWKPLYSAPLKPATWKNLSSNALPSPAHQARETQAKMESNVKWHEGANQVLKQAQKDANEKIGEQEWMLRNLPFKLAEIDRTKRQLSDVQDEVAKLILQNASLQLAVEQAQNDAIASGGSQQMIGESPIAVDGNQISWVWQRESFGAHKRNGNKLWVHNGYIRGKDTYYFVDSEALTLADTQTFVYVNQVKASFVTSIAQATAMPDDTATDYRWPLVRLVKTDPSGDGNYTWAVRKIYNVGDVPTKANDTELILDADGPNDATRHQSLQRKVTADVHNREGQLFQFNSHTMYSPATFSDFDPSGAELCKYQLVAHWLESDNRREVRYISLNQFKAYQADYATTAGSSGTTDAFPHAIEYHNDQKSPSPNQKSAGRVLACTSNTAWEWTDLAGLGDLTHYWADTSINNPQTGNFYTSGKLKVSNATAGSSTGGAIYASAGGIAGAQGCYFLKGSAAQAGYYGDASNVAKLCDGTYAVNASTGSVNSASAYYISDNAGASDVGDVTGAYVQGGIVIQPVGKTLTSIDASDLRPTDKIVVWR